MSSRPLVADLARVVTTHMANHPRGRQTTIGPSEVGHPCTRRLGYRLAGTPPVNMRHGWRPTVGVAVHHWLADAFNADNRDDVHGAARWLVEHRVAPTETLTGSCDLYDRETATVVDFKVVGTASLRDKKINGPGDQYRVQVNLYARGWHARGYPVAQVAIWFLPMSGELAEAHWWADQPDPDLARRAITRLHAVGQLVDTLHRLAPAALPTTPTHCPFCPWHQPATTNLQVGCPGLPTTGERTTPQ